MSNYSWIIKFVLLSLLLISVMMFFNFILNYNFYFNHNLIKIEKHSPDERKYKTNYLYHNRLSNDFDAVVLGSSVSTFLDQKEFLPSKTYNFSVNGMLPVEYNSALSYLEKHNTKNIKKVFIGLEFFVSNINEVNRIYPRNIETYLSTKDELFSLIKYLISINNIIKQIQSLLDRNTIFYEYNGNVKRHNKLSVYEVEYNIKRGLIRATEELSKYKYDENYKRILKDFFDNNNNNKNMTVFISPQSNPYLELLLDLKFDEYSRWIKETISIFGEILYFNYPNKITTNYQKNFMDARHYTTQTGNILIDDIVNSGHNNYVVLTMENVDGYLKSLKLKNDKK